MENNIWGKKNLFAIELKDYDSYKKLGKVRFWIGGKQYGDSKRKDELSDVVEGLKMLLDKRDSLYEKSFDSMTNEQIFAYCLFLNKDTRTFTTEDYELLNKFRYSYVIWFGEQFDNVNHITYYKDNFYHFLWSYNNDYSGRRINYLDNLEYGMVSTENFENVVQLFIQTIEG
jgi:hypothetical protein